MEIKNLKNQPPSTTMRFLGILQKKFNITFSSCMHEIPSHYLMGVWYLYGNFLYDSWNRRTDHAQYIILPCPKMSYILCMFHNLVLFAEHYKKLMKYVLLISQSIASSQKGRDHSQVWWHLRSCRKVQQMLVRSFWLEEEGGDLFEPSNPLLRLTLQHGLVVLHVYSGIAIGD